MGQVNISPPMAAKKQDKDTRRAGAASTSTGEPSIMPETWLPPEYVVCGDHTSATQVCLA